MPTLETSINKLTKKFDKLFDGEAIWRQNAISVIGSQLIEIERLENEIKKKDEIIASKDKRIKELEK